MKNILFITLFFLSLSLNAQINIRTVEYKKGSTPEYGVSNSTIDSKVFEIDLILMPKGNYKASKELVKLTVQNPNYSKVIVITDNKDEVISFENSTDFLNFMDEKGYKVTFQNKTKYNIEYVFSKSN